MPSTRATCEVALSLAQALHRLVLGAVPEAAGGLQRRELEDDDALQARIALDWQDLATADEVAAAEAGDHGRDLRAIGLEGGTVVHVDVGDQVGRHGALPFSGRTGADISRSTPVA